MRSPVASPEHSPKLKPQVPEVMHDRETEIISRAGRGGSAGRGILGCSGAAQLGEGAARGFLQWGPGLFETLKNLKLRIWTIFVQELLWEAL